MWPHVSFSFFSERTLIPKKLIFYSTNKSFKKKRNLVLACNINSRSHTLLHSFMGLLHNSSRFIDKVYNC